MTTRRNLALATAFLLLMAHVMFAFATPTGRTPDASVSARKWILKGYTASLLDDSATSRACYENAIRSPDFSSLDASERFAVLYKTALSEFRAGNAARANTLLKRATGYKQANAATWKYRLFTASRSHDSIDMAYSLTTIARRWPSLLPTLFPGMPLQLHRRLQNYQQDAVDQNMLDALFNANWPRSIDGADYLWLDLALIHLRNYEIKRAAQVAVRVKQPMLVLRMRIDKRFDPIRRLHPEAFDIDRLMRTQISEAQADLKAHPNQLAPIQHLQNLYIRAGQFERALTVSDPVVAVARKGDGPRTYTDYDTKYNWIIDNRARALAHQGHWTRAIHVMEKAACQTEYGDVNVSQIINLGAYYALNNHPDKAARAISRVGNMSDYGRMQLEKIKLYIAFERHDKPAIARHMDYLRSNREDAIGSWENALLLHGDLDEAAALMIKRLDNPDWRDDALLDVQDYPDGPSTYIGKRIDANLQRILKRKDVLAAVLRVGRIEHTNISP